MMKQCFGAIALVALAIGAGALWLGERAGMGVDDQHGSQLQIVQPAGDGMDEPEPEMQMPGH